MKKCFACRVEGLATRYIEASTAEEAQARLETELLEINDPHGAVLSVEESPKPFDILEAIGLGDETDPTPEA